MCSHKNHENINHQLTKIAENQYRNSTPSVYDYPTSSDKGRVTYVKNYSKCHTLLF